MDYNYIKPFIESTNYIIKEVAGTDSKKTSAYMTKSKQKELSGGLYIDIVGDITGRMVLNLSKELVNGFVSNMLEQMMPGGENAAERSRLIKDKDFVKSAVGELGNLISGRAITNLESSYYNCDIRPPVSFDEGAENIMEDDKVVAVIEFKSDIGDFDICIVNQDEDYSKHISILLYNISASNVYKMVYTFLPKGFYIYDVSNEEDIKKILGKTKIDFMIGDFDNTSYSKKKVLNLIRDTEHEEGIVIASYTSKSDDFDFKKLMDDFDIHYFIKKDEKGTNLVNETKDLLRAYDISPQERRKQIDVQIKPIEKWLSVLSLMLGGVV